MLKNSRKISFNIASVTAVAVGAIALASAASATVPAPSAGARVHHHRHGTSSARRGSDFGYAAPNAAPSYAPREIPATVEKHYNRMRYDWQLYGHSGS
jgi:hypothetical protein